MRYVTRRLPAALAAAALAVCGLAAGALPASAGVQRGALFDGFGHDLDENVALSIAESDARQNALNHGFTDCSVFESVVSQNAKTHVFFALVAVSCQDAA